jgi:hypothetical protein
MRFVPKQVAASELPFSRYMFPDFSHDDFKFVPRAEFDSLKQHIESLINTGSGNKQVFLPVRITGAMGSGKTRLGQEVGRALVASENSVSGKQVNTFYEYADLSNLVTNEGTIASNMEN